MKNKFAYFKKYHILNSILPNGVVILPYPIGNNVVSLLPVNVFFVCKFYKIISLLK